MKYYDGVCKSSSGKKVRVVYLPKRHSVKSDWAWTVLGKKKKWFSKKSDAIKYAKK